MSDPEWGHFCTDFELCPDCQMCEACCNCGDDER